MKLAFVYAGQGSQFAGMGKDLYEAYPAARAVFDNFPADFDLKTVCFEDPDGVIGRTRYTQPCMLAMAMAITDILAEQGVRPEMAAGLSLGEYGALYAAGVFDQHTAAELIGFRGRAMEQASEGVESGMTAILGLDRELVQKACEQAAGLGPVFPANYNCPGQIVIGGARKAVDAAAQNALLLGARKAVPLAVSGPFHTQYMKPAGNALAERFRSVAFGEMRIPVVFNCLGRAKTPEESIPELLVRQVQSPVYFWDSVEYMRAQGVDTILEVGPGKVLSGFIKKIDRSIKTYAVQDCASLEAALNALR